MPLKVRWIRVCQLYLPIVSFLVAAVLAIRLWQRQTAWVVIAGEVEASRTTITSPTVGVLVPISGRIKKFERVRQGDVIARVASDGLLGGLAQGEAKRHATDAVAEPGIPWVATAHQAAEIRAPVTGRVARVHLRPGQPVQAGQPILDLVEERASHIIAYIRRDHRIRPVPGMMVEVRAGWGERRVYSCCIEAIGSEVERIPDHLLKDYRVPEWGVAVRIVVPAEADLRPGEPAEVVFRRSSASGIEAVSAHVAAGISDLRENGYSESAGSTR